ncbi:MAG: hypothetical protein ABI834_06415 [Ginsengibacter sp.]
MKKPTINLLLTEISFVVFAVIHKKRNAKTGEAGLGENNAG